MNEELPQVETSSLKKEDSIPKDADAEATNLFDLKNRVETLMAKTNHLELFFNREQVYAFVRDDIWKKLFRWLGVLTILFGVSVWQTYKYIQKSIADKFAEPSIKDTLIQVAESQAAQIISNQVRPAVEEIQKEAEIFDGNLTQLRSKYHADYEKLKSEVNYLKVRNDVTRLADEAMAEGSRISYEKLRQTIIKGGNSDIVKAIRSEIFKIKNYYSTMTRLRTAELTVTDPSGVKYKDDEIPTAELISQVKNSPNWTVRTKAVEFLRNRKEKAVPEALIHTIENDQRLDVVKVAVDSFESVTGYRSSDVFGEDGLLEWWKKNSKTINQSFENG